MKSTKATNKIVSLLLVMAMLTSGFCIPQPSVHAETEETITVTNTKPQAEKITQKTENATIYGDGTGKKRAEIYAQDIRFKDEKGKLTDYDTSLIEDKVCEDYIYQTAKSNKPVQFPEKISEDTPVRALYEKYTLSINPTSSKNNSIESKEINLESKKVSDLYGEKEVKKTMVEYDGLWKQSSLQYEATNTGLKENIIIENRKSPVVYNFTISTRNCCLVSQNQLKNEMIKEQDEVRTESGEPIYIYDVQKQKIVGNMPAAYMTDANNSFSDDCGYCAEIEKKEVKSNEVKYTYRFKIIVDEKFIRDSDRKFPITIDPSVSWNEEKKERISSAYVCSTRPDSTYTDANTNILCVGKRDTAKDVCRAYLKFEGINAALEGMYIDKAKMTLTTTGSDSDMPIYIKNTESAWSANNITYATQPVRSEDALGSFTTMSSAEKITVDLDADMLYDCIRNEKTLYGFELTDSKKDDNKSSSKTAWFFNSVSVNNDKIPKLEVIYYDVDSNATPKLKYKVSRNRSGWSSYAEDGVIAGDLQQIERLQAINMEFEANGASIGKIKYRAYFENSGWTPWKNEGVTAGSNSPSDKMKSLEIKVYNAENDEESNKYDVYYRVYTESEGWLGWAKNGEEAGDYSTDACIEGVQAIVVPRLTYNIWATTKEGKRFLPNTNQWSDYILGAGDQNKIYQIATSFKDSFLSKTQKIRIQTYLQNGNVISGFGNNVDGNYVAIGGNYTNAIAGYNIQFDSPDLRAKYDILHITSSANQEKVEENWRKNDLLSGSKNYENSIEMLCIRAVPKGYEEGRKSCLAEKYITEKDGYSFVNAGESFNYPIDSKGNINYQISGEKNDFIFGTTGSLNGNWNGSCYGMALSSLLFYHGVWNYKDFVGNVDKKTDHVNGLEEQRGRKSKKLTDLIEYAQVSYGKNIDSALISDYSQIVTKLLNNKETKYIMLVKSFKNSGELEAFHAVVPLMAKNEGNGKYKVDIYDVNTANVTKQGTIDITNQKFSFKNGYNFTWMQLVDLEVLVSKNKTLYENIAEKVKNPAYTPKLNKQDVYEISVDSADDCIIEDEMGHNILEDKDVVKILPMDESNNYTYFVPRGKYVVKMKHPKESARVSAVSNQIGVHYYLSDSGEVVIDFKEDSSVQMKASFNDGKRHNMELEVKDTEEIKLRKKYSKQIMDVCVKKDKTIIK